VQDTTLFLLDAAFSTPINFMGYRPLYQVVYAFLRNSVEIRKKMPPKASALGLSSHMPRYDSNRSITIY
jgi:hypothetical protein